MLLSPFAFLSPHAVGNVVAKRTDSLTPQEAECNDGRLVGGSNAKLGLQVCSLHSLKLWRSHS